MKPIMHIIIIMSMRGKINAIQKWKNKSNTNDGSIFTWVLKIGYGMIRFDHAVL